MYSKIFAKKLKIAREESGFSQREVAKELGISQPSIAQYETGSVEPNIDTIVLFADFYGVTIDWLFGKGKAEQKNIIRNSKNFHGGNGDMYISLTPEQIRTIKES